MPASMGRLVSVVICFQISIFEPLETTWTYAKWSEQKL